MTDNTDFNFGDKVVFWEYYKRLYRFSDAFYERKYIAIRKGIYIGWRLLSNGKVDVTPAVPMSSFYPEPPDPEPYIATEYFKAALVAFDERKNPVYVPFNGLRHD